MGIAAGLAAGFPQHERAAPEGGSFFATEDSV